MSGEPCRDSPLAPSRQRESTRLGIWRNDQATDTLSGLGYIVQKKIKGERLLTFDYQTGLDDRGLLLRGLAGG